MLFADTKVVQNYDISKFIFKNFTTCANDRHLPSLTLFRLQRCRRSPCAISVLLTYSFSVLYYHALRRPPAATPGLYCLKYTKNPDISKDSHEFFPNKSRYITAWHPPPIRIGANYSSTQRYFGNPRSPMSMQCGTAEKFGNLVYFIILSQYNTEGSLQVGCLFLEMKMKQKKAAQSLRSLSKESDSKQPNTNK